MGTESIDKLSERQRDCLRLVLRHMQSKEIGRELGISPYTVDNHLKAAMQALGVNGRVEAALLLAQSEHIGTSQRLASQSPPVAPAPEPAIMASSISDGDGRRQDMPARVLREEQVPFELFQPRVDRGWKPPVPTAGRRTNDLTHGQRLAWIVLIGIACILMFGAIPGGLYALSSLL